MSMNLCLINVLPCQMNFYRRLIISVIFLFQINIVSAKVNRYLGTFRASY